MTLSIKDTVLRKRSEILSQIVAGAIDPRRTQRLLDELATADQMLQAEKGSSRDTRYATCPRAIDAITIYLEERGVPATEDEIIAAVLAGGWRGGGRENILNLHKGIGIFLNGTGKRIKLLKKIEGLIGLYKWNDSLFEPEK
jgi:hypothetical protein